MGKSTYLTKSRYMYFLQCPKRLWLYVNRPELATPSDAGQQLRFDEGHQIGLLAQEQYPGGVLAGENFGEAIQNTRKLLQEGQSTLYEATFSAGGIGAMVDILVKNDDDSVDLIEVKSSTKVKPEHAMDVAFQNHVVKKAGLEVNSASLMHVNNQCVHPDLGNLFSLEDLSDNADSLEGDIATGIAEAQDVLREPNEPDVAIGYHCNKPYECPFKAYCHSDLPKHSVFTIPGIRQNRLDGLIAEGIFDVRRVTPSCSLNDSQWEYVHLVNAGEPSIDYDTIQAETKNLVYPLLFLDFEARHAAVPRFPGMRPYNELAFQFSCHVLREDGRLEHEEYLHPDLSDPREPLAVKLLATLGDSGTIVMYTPYEERIIKRLATGVPHLGDELLGLLPRLWDLAVIVKNYVRHPEFCGSYSIKKVLPVLVPELSYEGLGVSGGDEAGVVWDRYIAGESEDPEQDWEDLKTYCRLDTEAMVRVWGVLQYK